MAESGEDAIPSPLLEILPEKYTYFVSDYQAQGTGFTASVKVGAQDEDAARQWLVDFQQSSKTTWRVMRTCPMAGKYVLSKKIYRCHHGQQRKAKEGTTRHSKDTGCCAKLTISVRRSVPSSGRKSRNSDPHLEVLPTLVTISWEHNHAISIPAALKFRDVSADTCHKLEDLYRRGHSPASALNVLELDLQDESPEEYILNSADRALCPDLKFCYRLYYKIFQISTAFFRAMVKLFDLAVIVYESSRMRA
ncbi:uncharacterized protein [Diadema antillarum]|uniref:uncharacterized protein n=1 Tax=Diadema antillarum TaxID=105358 RepID=UPI003A860497